MRFEPAQIRTLDRDGFAMVTTILVVLVLSILAVGVVWIAGTEKKTSFAEGVHMRTVLAADAGSEAAINFIRVSDAPPRITDFATMTVITQDDTPLEGSQSYAFDANYLSRQIKPGWSLEYQDFDYRISSEGKASASGHSEVDVVVSRLFKVGY